MEEYKENSDVEENFFYEGFKFLGQMALTTAGALVVGLPLMYVGVIGITQAIPNEIEIAKRPPVILDINGDGIKDKVFYRLKEEKVLCGLLGTWNKLEKVVEYGNK